jgi:hypothetical protein
MQMTAEKVFHESIDAAGKIAACAVRATDHSGAGILGAILAAAMLARVMEWPRDKLTAALDAVIADLWHDDDKAEDLVARLNAMKI